MSTLFARVFCGRPTWTVDADHQSAADFLDASASSPTDANGICRSGLATERDGGDRQLQPGRHRSPRYLALALSESWDSALVGAGQD
jgi:hypothetical protein